MAGVAFLLSLLAPTVAGVMLHQPKPEAIHAKWDKMDDFLEVMFTMACEAKHGKDVSGLAAEKLDQGKVDGHAGYTAHVKKTQARNLEGLKKACGLIDASGKKRCRQGCADRWNGLAVKRHDCDEKCVTAYAKFEASCSKKVDDLDKVYDLKTKKAAGQKQCYEGHCKEFPMVWMKEQKDMKKEVESQCTSRCTSENVKASCQKKWLLDGELVSSEIGTRCNEESGVVECFNEEKEHADTDYDKCKSDSTATCDKAYIACNKDKKDAKAFCTDRKKLCLKQADEKCLDENREALKVARTDCEKDAKEDYDECHSELFEQAKEDHEKKCMSERLPKCKEDCTGKCDVDNMNKCLVMLKSGGDPGKMFCKDFWRLLHTSSEVDPLTGNPIVLLARKSSLAPIV